MDPQLYRQDITGLRALAVMLVIGFHVGAPGFELGYLGVDIFFVISGFLVGGHIYHEVTQGNLDLMEFYTRRANRLLPALVVMLVSTAFVACFFLLPSDLDYLKQSYIAAAFFYSNLFFLRNTGYFDPSSEENLLLHTWSLSVEEQFYFLIPFFIYALIRFRYRRIITAISVLLVISLLTDAILGLLKPSYNFFFTPSRLWEFLLGMLVATRRDSRLPVWCHITIGMLGSVVVGAAFFASMNNVLNIIAVMAAALFLMAPEGLLIKSPFKFAPVRWLGLMSYSLYLWHQPVIGLWRYANPIVSTGEYIILIIVILLLSAVSFFFIETPFRRNKRHLLRLLPHLLLFISLGFGALHITSKITEDETGVNIEERKFQTLVNKRLADCSVKFRCGKIERGGKRNAIILIGDSHAEHFSVGLSTLALDYDVFYFVTGNVFYSGLNKSGIIQAVEDLTSEYQQVRIVLAAHYLGNFSLLEFGDTYVDGLSPAVEQLIKYDSSLVLLEDTPKFRNHPRHCVEKYQLLGSERFCEQNTQGYLRDIEFSSKSLRSIATKFGLPTPIGFAEHLCNPSECSMLRDGELLYRDTNHLSFNGSDYVARYLFDELQKRWGVGALQTLEEGNDLHWH